MTYYDHAVAMKLQVNQWNTGPERHAFSGQERDRVMSGVKQPGEARLPIAAFIRKIKATFLAGYARLHRLGAKRWLRNNANSC